MADEPSVRVRGILTQRQRRNAEPALERRAEVGGAVEPPRQSNLGNRFVARLDFHQLLVAGVEPELPDIFRDRSPLPLEYLVQIPLRTFVHFGDAVDIE